jgi:hypothetical protein
MACGRGAAGAVYVAGAWTLQQLHWCWAITTSDHSPCFRINLLSIEPPDFPQVDRMAASLSDGMPCRVPEDTPMYDMFKLFQTGRSHMVLLTEPPAAAAAAADGTQPPAAAAAGGDAKPPPAPFSPRPALLGSSDASGAPVGIITIEDVIEELMQTEIGAGGGQQASARTG